MPTVPATAARDLPEGVTHDSVVWDETIPGGGYATRRLARGTRLRLSDVEGDACVSLLVYNERNPAERLNVADTIKVQWNGYLSAGRLLLSDMGRVLMSVLADTSGRHDVFCGPSTAAANVARFGDGENHSPHPAARDRLMIALTKEGLGRRDLMPCVNLFKGVRVGPDGSLHFVGAVSDGARGAGVGAYVELRAEMDLIVVLANTPHVLDDRTEYVCTRVRATAWRAEPTSRNDPIRNATPEALRAFQNVEEYLLR